jgi:hypothetical protein
MTSETTFRYGLTDPAGRQPDQSPIPRHLGYILVPQSVSVGGMEVPALRRMMVVDVRWETIRGTRMVDIPDHADARGQLFVVDRAECLPFELKRVFYLLNTPSGAVRAEHATTCHEALIALRGSFVVDLDNGTERATLCVSSSDKALCIHAGVWLRLRDFSCDALVLVAASQVHEDVSHFDRPCADLLENLTETDW